MTAAPATVELPLALPDDCAACGDRLCGELSAHAGVVALDPVAGRDIIRVTFDPDRCSTACLTEALTVLRDHLTGRFAHASWQIDGMDCSECATTIERAVRRLDGVTAVSVSFPARAMRVEFDPASSPVERIGATVGRLGYRIQGVGRPVGRLGRLLATGVSTPTSAAALVAALAVDLATGVTATPLYAASVVAGGLPLARSGIAVLVATRRPGIKLLMAIAAIGATAIGAWLEAALVVVLFSIGEWLEARAVDRARRQLGELVSLAPQTARVRRNPGSGPLALVTEVELKIADVRVGDLAVVRPGERIPVDGTVRDGASAVDQAPLTGESTPIEKAVGDAVLAGSLNTTGVLVVEASSEPGDTTLDRIGRLVAEAQARRSPSERWVDAFARWYTPAIVGIAILVAALPPAFGVAFSASFYDALALLILACPCALVISTPVAIVSALGRSSAAGVLVKGGAHLERAAAIRSVAFDKTGTLTLGRPRVTEIVPLAGEREDELLTLAASVEHASEHPLARAILDAARERGLELRPVEAFEALTGLGARGCVDHGTVAVGDARLMQRQIKDEAARDVDRLRQLGQTAIVVLRDDAPIGLVGVADTIRPEAAEAVADLRLLGVDSIVLLTGDNATTARAVASTVGIEDVRASLLPQDKAAAIGDLPGPLAMVGDGVNDAPALAAAALGVAMGSAGSDTAIEVADVAIMGDDPRRVAGLIGLARWTRSVVQQNIAFSLATKLAAASILAAGALPLWGAVVADVGASLIVVGNGLRLARGRPHGRARGLPLLRSARS